MSPSPDLTSRLLPLSDGRPGLRTTIYTEVRENSCNSCLDFTSSDDTLDRYHEIIVPAGWKLDTYHRNPVFQNAHQYGDVIFTLGKAVATEVRSGKLFQRIEFATDVNPMAKIAYGLYRGKFLNAVSVGFIPIKWENGDGSGAGVSPVGSGAGVSPVASGAGVSPAGSAGVPAGGPPLPIASGEGSGVRAPLSLDTRHASPQQFRRRYLEQELLEVSAVAIPANPNALALALKSGAIEKSDLHDLADLLRQTLGVKSPLPATKDPGEGRISCLMLQVARQLHDILRHA